MHDKNSIVTTSRKWMMSFTNIILTVQQQILAQIHVHNFFHRSVLTNMYALLHKTYFQIHICTTLWMVTLYDCPLTLKFTKHFGLGDVNFSQNIGCVCSFANCSLGHVVSLRYKFWDCVWMHCHWITFLKRYETQKWQKSCILGLYYR